MSTSVALVDAHVHVYPEFSAERLLSSAWRNFSRAAQSLGANRWQGFLLLTETARDHWFEAAWAAQGNVGRWSVQRRPGCEVSLSASSEEGRLVLVAGRQVVTRENIELHALGTRATFADGQPAAVVREAIEHAGALAVVPWGVGKWTGGRGRLVRELLSAQSTTALLAADNGGRPAVWREPLLELGSHAILRGSDPLPLPGEERRAGESGVWLQAAEEASVPQLLESLRRLPRSQVHPFGPDEGPLRFLRNQIALRLRRRP